INPASPASIRVLVTRALGAKLAPLFLVNVAKISNRLVEPLLLRVSNQLMWTTPLVSAATAGIRRWPLLTSFTAVGVVNVNPPAVFERTNSVRELAPGWSVYTS